MHQRLFIEKRPEFADDYALTERLKTRLDLAGLQRVRRLAVYDLYDCPEALLPAAISRVFSDPVSDEVRDALPKADFTLVIEPLPGQFDQRADSAMQCLRLLDDAFAPTVVTSAQAWLFEGDLNDDARAKLRQHLINPIDSREKIWRKRRCRRITPPTRCRVMTGSTRLMRTVSSPGTPHKASR